MVNDYLEGRLRNEKDYHLVIGLFIIHVSVLLIIYMKLFILIFFEYIMPKLSGIGCR